MISLEGVVGAEISFFDLPARIVELLRIKLSYPHPDYVKAVRMGRWLGGLPSRYVCMTEHPDGRVSVPRGAVEDVRVLLRREDYAVTYRSERAWGAPIKVELPDRIVPRNYQKNAVEALRRRGQGMVVLPCGGGKTIVGLGAIAALKRTTLILVHTTDLLEQWLGEIEDILGLTAGRYDAAGKELEAPIVVASVFSIAKVLESNPAAARRFGLVITDECHHVPAESFKRCISNLPAFYRLGLTATPDRDDGHGKLVDWSFGSRLVVKTAVELMAAGYLMQPEVVEVESDFFFPSPEAFEGNPKHYVNELDKALCEDEPRAELVARLAVGEYLSGQVLLVLANRKVMCAKLKELIESYGVPCKVVISKTRKKVRKETINSLREGETFSVVIATALANEGLDIRRLSRVILAWPEKARGRIVQQTGRVMRVHAGKAPKIFDVIDRRVPLLARRAADRRRTFRKLLGV